MAHVIWLLRVQAKQVKQLSDRTDLVKKGVVGGVRRDQREGPASTNAHGLRCGRCGGCVLGGLRVALASWGVR